LSATKSKKSTGLAFDDTFSLQLNTTKNETSFFQDAQLHLPKAFCKVCFMFGG